MTVIGHENTKRQLRTALDSATQRNMALPHMLFAGAAGCGKTSMAKEVAKMCDGDFIPIVPEDIKDMSSVMNLLESLNHTGYNERGDRVGNIKPSIVFMDEIHRLPIFGQEKLGIVMENYLIESGRGGKYYWVPYFTFIGATTIAGELSRPFLNRFKLNFIFRPYSQGESEEIVKYHALGMNVLITNKAVRDVATRSRGVPRLMVRYLERCRDTALAYESVSINSYIADQTFKDIGIDAAGFSVTEITILKALYGVDKAVGLDNLSIITNESAKTIRNEIEPYLIQSGLIVRSGSGRLITRAGREYLDAQGYIVKRAGKVEIDANYTRI